jgi:hypothetical protein
MVVWMAVLIRSHLFSFSSPTLWLSTTVAELARVVFAEANLDYDDEDACIRPNELVEILTHDLVNFDNLRDHLTKVMAAREKEAKSKKVKKSKGGKSGDKVTAASEDGDISFDTASNGMGGTPAAISAADDDDDHDDHDDHDGAGLPLRPQASSSEPSPLHQTASASAV